MIYTNPDAEEALENATMALFAELGWQTVNAYHEVYGADVGGSNLGRQTRNEVVLRPRLQAALSRLNPHLPPEAIAQAIAELTRERGAMAMAQANREVHQLLKDGVKVTCRGSGGEEQVETVRVIDWQRPENNEFLAVQQFWVTGEVYTRRADLVGFVNGLPLLFGELKAHHRRIEDAYRKNLRDYKDTIPHLFWYTALILLSNGSDARVGTITSPWEYFNEWKKIDSEGEEGVISLETAVRGTCAPARILDIVENFILYQESRGGLKVIVSLYHQYLGVNSAVDAVRQIGENGGRLGVFWHTQGSGKSLSMVFFSQKVLRVLPGNWTFVVVTDRVDLDDQIYKAFARSGALIEPEGRVRAGSGEHLRQLLGEDHRYVFTTIQKFGTRGGERHPVLSRRSDIVVLTDEAHRSQYDILAMNMRHALPNAAFIAFTATPLMAGEEKTRQVFGEYVSVYPYRQSNEDRSTVPLYYENRIPEIELANQDLNADMDRLLEEAELDGAQEARLALEFTREYHLIARDERLEKVAEDIVNHFVHRGYPGKGMVVSIDKLTAVKMYDKVRKYWRRTLAELRSQAEAFQRVEDGRRGVPPEELAEMRRKIVFMEETDMAVVLSQEQGEVEKFGQAGLDIVPHRKRMLDEALDEKFKDPADPFRLVFVCAMWRTGFDAPACSTIYLDRPMRNHTLMQTIARANRVFGDKVNGLIVDYVGIFRDLQRALAIYSSGLAGSLEPGERPIEPKDALVDRLQEAIVAAERFCAAHGVALAPILDSQGYDRIALMDDAVEQILVNDEAKEQYLALAGKVEQLFRAILPDARAGEFGPRRHVLAVLAAKIRSLAPAVDISRVIGQVETLLDASVAARRDAIQETDRLYDLRQIDPDALRKRFRTGRKRTEAELLRGSVAVKLQRMLRLNPGRIDYLATFQRLIDEYNAGSCNVEELFEALVHFVQGLNQEEQRAVAEGLSEEELALFDILTRPGPPLSAREKREVKRIARELLATLKEQKLVLDWRKRQRSRAAVQVAIEDWIWQLPEACYSDEMCREKSVAVYQHVYDNYWGAGQSVYVQAA